MPDWVEERGVVVAVDNGWATVRVQRQSTCGSCAARTGCGNGALSEVVGRRALELRVPAPDSLQPGDRVTLGIRDSALVSGAVMVYLVPLAGLIGGAAFLRLTFPALAEGWLIVAGLGGFTLGLFAAHRWLRAHGNRFAPVLLGHEPQSLA